MNYALDSLRHSTDSVAAGYARRCRRGIDSSVACCCANNVDFQLGQRPPESDLSGHNRSTLVKNRVHHYVAATNNIDLRRKEREGSRHEQS
jgi:hypothetical protein